MLLRFFGLGAAVCTLFGVITAADIPAVAGEIAVVRQSKSEFSIEGEYISAEWKPDGRVVFRWNQDDLAFLQLDAKRVLGSTELGRAGSWSHVQTEVEESPLRAVVREIWQDRGLRANVLCTYTISHDKPYFRIDLAAENDDDHAQEVYVLFAADYPESYGKPNRAMAFASRGGSPKEIRKLITGDPLKFDLSETFFRTRWGIHDLSWLPQDERSLHSIRPEIWPATAQIPWTEGQGLFLPVVCVYRDKRTGSGGPVLFTENCMSFGMVADSHGLAITRRFHLAAKRGSTDAALDLGDGAGPRPYSFYLGYVPDPSWESLYHDYYHDAFRSLSYETPASPSKLPEGGLGGFGGPFMDAIWSDEWAKWNAFANIKWVDNWMQHTNPDKLRRFGCPGVDVGHRWKLMMGMSDNAMVAPIPNPDYWSAADYYYKFEDSWVHAKDGRVPLPSWEGYAVNQSPRFGFGQHQLNDIRAKFEQYGFDGFFLDYFGGGRGVDWGHRYEHLPFYPDQIALNEYTRELTCFLHNNGKFYIANVPDASTQALRWADMVFGDIGYFAYYYKLISGYLPFSVTGIPYSGTREEATVSQIMDGLAGGFSTSLAMGGHSGWYLVGEITPEKERVLRIWARNFPLLFHVSRSALVAGDLFSTNFFRHRDGYVFVSARSMSDDDAGSVELREVHFPIDRLQLSSAASYAVYMWDPLDGFSLLASAVTGEQLARGLTLEVQPGEVEMAMIVPAGTGLLMPCLAAVPDAGVHLRYTTAAIESAEWKSTSGADRFQVLLSDPSELESETVLHWGQRNRPKLRLSGAVEVEIEWLEAGARIRALHAHEPLRLVASWDSPEP